MNFEQFKKLPFLKKIEWIAQYYGVWIIVSIVAIFVAISLVRSVFFPKPISDVCILILSDDHTRDEIPKLEDEIAAATGGSASVEIYNVSEAYGDSAYTIKLLSDQLDLVIAPKEQTDSMMESGYLVSAEKMKNEDLYLGIPERARNGEILDKTIDYFKAR